MPLTVLSSQTAAIKVLAAGSDDQLRDCMAKVTLKRMREGRATSCVEAAESYIQQKYGPTLCSKTLWGYMCYKIRKKIESTQGCLVK